MWSKRDYCMFNLDQKVILENPEHPLTRVYAGQPPQLQVSDQWYRLRDANEHVILYDGPERYSVLISFDEPEKRFATIAVSVSLSSTITMPAEETE